MQLLNLTFFLVSSAAVADKSGVFDNVTVLVKGLDKTQVEDVIFIEFDDTLSPYLKNKPSDVVIINNQFVPKLEPDSVSNLTVQNLTITNSGLRQILSGAFKNLPRLRVLDLSFNLIEDIRSGVFNHLTFEHLNLSHNKIARIDYKALSHLRLKLLSLSHNHISRWSKDWLSESSIVHLDMSHNFIEDLPSNAFRLMVKTGDGSLVFSYNQLRKINDNVFTGFQSLESLHLDGNMIDRLSSSAFGSLSRVRILNLNNNSLTEVSGELLKTTRVEVLMLEDNKLRCLSTELFTVEELDIDGNPITCFCVNEWLEWRNYHSNPSIYHIVNLEQDCI